MLTLKISCEQPSFHIGMRSSPLTRQFVEEHIDTHCDLPSNLKVKCICNPKRHNENQRALNDCCLFSKRNTLNGRGQASQHLQAPRFLHGQLEISSSPRYPDYDWVDRRCWQGTPVIKSQEGHSLEYYSWPQTN